MKRMLMAEQTLQKQIDALKIYMENIALDIDRQRAKLDVLGEVRDRFEAEKYNLRKQREKASESRK